MRSVGEVEKLSNTGCSLKVVTTAFADGLDMKCQRKKRIKDGSEAIGKVQLLLTKLYQRLWEEKSIKGGKFSF